VDTVLLDVRDSDMTLSEILGAVERFRSDNPDMDVFLDGDRMAIIGRKHAIQTTLER
jgi:hypothetical protein